MQRKNNIMHRVFISWAVIGAGALLLGGLIGYWVVKRVDTTQTTTQTETTLIYGLPDGKIFTVNEEIPEYSTSNSEFSPLDVPLGTDVQAFTFYLCKAYDIDFNFAMAVMQQESGFQADAVSPGGDYGLMQISSVNHGWLSDELGITDFLDPYSNVKAGLYILRSLFQKYETPEKVLMAYNIGETGATQLVNGALLVASAFQDNWGWIAPIVWGIVAAFAAYNVVLGIYNGIQAVSNGLKAASAMADQVHTAALMMESGATFTATAAQYGFNAALLACPVTWIVAAVLALIVILYALVGIINQVAGTSISATGLITGAVAVAGAFILNIGIGLYNSFIAVIAAFVNFFIGIIEWVLNAANGGFNSFGDAVANLIGQIISWFLSLGQIVTTIIDAIFGTDWTAGLEGLKNSVTQWGKNENAITLDRMDTSTAGLQRFDYGDAASAGYDFGAGLESKVGNLFNFSGSIPSVEDYASLIADNANLSTLPDIAYNTGKIKDMTTMTPASVKSTSQKILPISKNGACCSITTH